MSLQRCRECGHYVSSKAKACPECGFPGPAPTRASGARRLARAILLTSLVLAVVGAGIAVRLYEESRPVEPIRPTATPTTFPRLSAELGRAGGRLLVTNRDDHAWTSCIADINAGVRGGSFSRELGDVGAGEQVAARLSTFARADGRRFDPDAEPVQVVDLHCSTPGGEAHFSGRP